MAATDSQRVQRIGIIGAGAAGLAALKTILDTPQYNAGQWIPTAFEARPNVGGVWLPSESIPGESPSPPPTPLYDSLTTNLPHPIMAFSSLSFPPSTSLFPKAEVVQTYLETYADVFGLRRHILFNHRVVHADWAPEGYWVVHAQTEQEGLNGETDKAEWHVDLLLVCNGHHNVPRYPSSSQIPGLSTWLEAGRASHSMFYRNPSSIPVLSGLSSPASSKTELASSSPSTSNQYPHLKNQTILIIGGGPSGSDITAELVPLAARVLHSFSPNSAAARQAARAAGIDTSPDSLDASSSPSPGITRSAILKPRVARFSEDEIVYFEDGSEVRDVDFCIIATGYEIAFPFFRSTPPSTSSSRSLSPSLSANASPSSASLNPISHLNADRPPNTNTDSNPKPNFTIHNALVPSHISPSHIDTRLRNTSWSVFPLARHLFGLPGCGFASAPDSQSWSASNSVASSNPHSHSSPSPSPTSASTPAPNSTQGSNLPAAPPPPPINITPQLPTLPPPTTLAFLGLLVRVAPLPLVEAQARAALAAFACDSDTESDSGNNDAIIDWTREEEDVLERWEGLRGRWEAGRPQSQSGLGLGKVEGDAGKDTGTDMDTDTERGRVRVKEKKELSMRMFISREWQRILEEMEQFDYRDALDDFADALNGHPQTERVRVRPWERYFYAEKNLLRTAWRELERRGVAEEWVRGVGEGKGKEGEQEEEWVAFMGRVLDFGRTL